MQAHQVLTNLVEDPNKISLDNQSITHAILRKSVKFKFGYFDKVIAMEPDIADKILLSIPTQFTTWALSYFAVR